VTDFLWNKINKFSAVLHTALQLSCLLWLHFEVFSAIQV